MEKKTKRGHYDDLYLALYTPNAVFIYAHDHPFGVSTNGKAQACSCPSVRSEARIDRARHACHYGKVGADACDAAHRCNMGNFLVVNLLVFRI